MRHPRPPGYTDACESRGRDSTFGLRARDRQPDPGGAESQVGRTTEDEAELDARTFVLRSATGDLALMFAVASDVELTPAAHEMLGAMGGGFGDWVLL